MNTQALARQIVLLVILVVAAAVALYWANRPADDLQTREPVPAHVSVTVVAHANKDTLIVSDIEVTPPATALMALEQAAAGAGVPMATRTYDFGRLVVSIGGVTAGEGGDWTYTVNGEFMPVGVEACYLTHGDRLEFAFGEAPPDSL